ncbi:MAG: PTS fructose transporter subunit IIB [Romboutsia sp.]
MKRKIVAVCACPMGLAHTFMAAEAIEQKSKELGYDVKVETQGADGITNELSKEDIQRADIIIHAVSITPENMWRFENYEVYEVTLQEIISNPESIIKEIEHDLSI